MMSNEDAEILKQFSQELASLYDSKPPISKGKMVQLTKSAMKGIKFYKHVVMAVEKFIHRCKPEYKLPGLYVIDSIVRQSRHQFGTDKDVFAPRFCKNLENTLQAAASLCADEDRPKVVRIMNLWLENNVFPEEAISPILADFKNMDVTVIPAAEEQSIALEKAKSKSENKPSKNIPEAPTPSSNPEKLSKLSTGEKTTQQSSKKENNNNEQEKTEFLQQIQKLTSSLINQQQKSSGGGKKSKTAGGGDSDRKLTKKILSQYDYSDDDGDEVEELEEDGDDSVGESSPDKLNAGQNDSDMSLNFAHAAQNLLNNPQILHQIQKMQQTITRTNSKDAALSAAAPPPPVPAPTAPPFDFRGHAAANKPVFDNQAYPPPAEPLPPGFDSSGGGRSAAAVREDRDERRRVSAPNEESTSSSTTRHSGDRDRRKRSSRDRSRSRSRDRKRKHRSRSRSKSPATAYSKRHKSATNNNNNNNDENASNKKDDDRGDRDRDRERSRRSRSPRGDRRDRDRERDRRSRGMLSNVKAKHASIYSRTLWFGKIPQSCEPDELKEILKEYGEPVSIDLIPPRGCAYVVMPDRKTAYKVLDSRRDLKLQNRVLKKAWAMGKGVKNDFEEDWDADNGVTHIPWDRLRSAQPAHVDFLSLWNDGGTLDVESLPDDLKQFYDEKGRVAGAAMVVRPGGGGPGPMPPLCGPGMFPTMMPPPGFPAHLAMAQQMFLANAGVQRPPPGNFVLPPPPPPVIAGGGAATSGLMGQATAAPFRHPAAVNFPAALFAMPPTGQGQNVLRLPPPTLAQGLSPQRPPPRMPPQSLMSAVVMAPPPNTMNRLPPPPSSLMTNNQSSDRR